MLPAIAARYRAGLLAFILLSASGRAAEALPSVSLPPAAEGQWVARDMTYNGLRMSIRMFRRIGDLDFVMNYYDRVWHNKYSSDSISRQSRGGWQIILAEGDEHFMSVRMRQEGKTTHGVVTVSENPSEATPTRQTDIPLPDSVEIVSVQQYNDGGRKGEHVLAGSDASVDVLARKLDRRLADSGWKPIVKRPSKAGGQGLYREYQQASQHLQIEVAPTPDAALRTGLTITWIK